MDGVGRTSQPFDHDQLTSVKLKKQDCKDEGEWGDHDLCEFTSVVECHCSHGVTIYLKNETVSISLSVYYKLVS